MTALVVTHLHLGLDLRGLWACAWTIAAVPIFIGTGYQTIRFLRCPDPSERYRMLAVPLFVALGSAVAWAWGYGIGVFQYDHRGHSILLLLHVFSVVVAAFSLLAPVVDLLVRRFIRRKQMRGATAVAITRCLIFGVPGSIAYKLIALGAVGLLLSCWSPSHYWCMLLPLSLLYATRLSMSTHLTPLLRDPQVGQLPELESANN